MSGLQYLAIQEGKGEPPEQGDVVVVSFRGFHDDTGREFLSQHKYGPTLDIRIGAHHLPRGFDEALTLMKPGSHWRFRFPAALAFGSEGKLPDVQPHQDVWFDIELRGVR